MTTSPKQRTPLLPILAVGLLAMLVGAWLGARMLAEPPLDSAALHGTYLEGGRTITDFQLIDHHGELFTREQLQEQWTLLFFGFTHCPDICPMTLLQLGQVQDKLHEAGLGTVPKGVFVTVDPERDTPDRLAAYVTGFHEDFVGVTGALDEIDVLARNLGIAHKRHGNSDDQDYMVDHGSAVLLVNPAGDLQALWQFPHRAEQIAADMQQILTYHGEQ